MAHAVATSNEEIVRVVFPLPLKAQFRRKCEDSGQTMSERVRQLVIEDLATGVSPADRLSAILSSAQRKNDMAGLPQPTIEDIDAFIDQVRSERIESGFAS